MHPISRPITPPRGAEPSHAEPRADWFRVGTIAGFIATFAMTAAIAVAYGIANALGDASGTTLERWFHALSHNRLTEDVGNRFFVGMILNLLLGLVWGIVYARIGEPHLAGPAWRRGVTFATIPFVLSITVFFPMAGIGVFGNEIDAGILPVLGSLILHVIYGSVLGTVYCLDLRSGLTTAQGETEAAARAERGAMVGIISGIVIGFGGGWLVAPTMTELASRSVIGVAGALSGAAIGLLIGSLLGMNHSMDDMQE